MNLTDKMAYLRGMVDGMELDLTTTKEGKVLGQLLDVMQEMTAYVTDLQTQVDELTEVCDLFDQDLGDLEDIVYDEDDDDDYSSRRESPRSSSGAGSAQPKSPNDTPVLDNFGTDMTRAAAENRLDPIVGREKEIERLAQILSRRKKNNPVLIGEPGVGKSAIVEGLALRIIQRKVSRVLFDKRVISLDMASIVAGTKYRGQFEERIKAILNEYYDQGLRMIEIYKHQFQDLSSVIAQIKNRNYRFIIYMDDLSFEENEVEYKFLKAVIEGGVETRPDNVLIYATSNRRHLVRGCLALVHRLVNVRRLNDEI